MMEIFFMFLTLNLCFLLFRKTTNSRFGKNSIILNQKYPSEQFLQKRSSI